MKSLTIKNIPDEIYSALKQQASERGRSLNSMVIEVLSQQADFEARRQRMLASWDDLESFVASQTYSDVDSADLIREDRDSH